MSSKSVSVEQVSRRDFDRQVHRGHAGAVADIESASVIERWRTVHPDWRGRYWTYIPDDHGVLRLRPLNVARAERHASTA